MRSSRFGTWACGLSVVAALFSVFSVPALAQRNSVARDYFNRGARLYNAHDDAGAAKQFQAAVNADPEFANCYYYLGMALLAQATLDSAGHTKPAPGTDTAFQMYLGLDPHGPHAADARTMLKLLSAPESTGETAKLLSNIRHAQNASLQSGAKSGRAKPAGPAEAEFERGMAVYNGQDANKFTAAMLHFRRAADLGNAMAAHWIGLLYFRGQGVNRDYAQSMEWERKAADKGLAVAQYDMGNFYYSAWGVPQNFPEAFMWYRKASDGGFADAQHMIGLMYFRGQLGPQDYAQAMTWFRKAADQSLPSAMFDTGNMYFNGWGVPQDYAQARVWFEKAADAGDDTGQQYLGWMYENGLGVTKDTSQALALYQKAAAQGNATAENQLGNFYLNGVSVVKDYGQALAWYQKSAAQGNHNAQESLGWLFQNGLGVNQDYSQALAWYQKSAAQGNAVAENQLGWFYQHGLGVPVDLAQARAWYEKGAAGGSSSAKANLAALDQQAQQAQQQAQTAAQAQADAAASAQQAEAEREQQEMQDRQDKIQQLQQDAEEADQEAQNWDNQAEQLSNDNNCSAMAAALCQGIGELGAAKARQNAAKARQQAEDDREQIAQLQNMPVHHVTIDTSYGGALQQQEQQHPTPTIQQTAAQQEAQMQAIGAANDAARRAAAQQRAQQAEQQAAMRRAAEESAQQSAQSAQAPAPSQTQTTPPSPSSFTVTGAPAGNPTTLGYTDTRTGAQLVQYTGMLHFNIPSGFHFQSGEVSVIASSGNGDANQMTQSFNAAVTTINQGHTCRVVGSAGSVFAHIVANNLKYEAIAGQTIVAACITIAPDGMDNAPVIYQGATELTVPASVSISMTKSPDQD